MTDHTHLPPEDVDREVEHLRPDATLGDLLSELTEEFGQLVRQELDLARLEAGEQLDRVKRAALVAVCAGISGLLALMMLSHSLAQLLDEWMTAPLAWAIVGALWIVVALVLVAIARRHASEIHGLPDTTTTLKEDLQWARAQRN